MSGRAAPTPVGVASDGASRRAALDRRQVRQLIVITLAAIGIYVTLRLLPTGTNLSHQDFRAQGTNSIEFCDPLNPQFIPVSSARSPVTLTVLTDHRPAAGAPVHGLLTLRTSTGKPVGPADLLVVHTRPLHLMIVDPTLTDYQHVHPEPTRTPGEWSFSFAPRLGGTYRLFADFTPVATGRGLYASTDLAVGAAADGQPAGADLSATPPDWGAPVADKSAPAEGANATAVEREGYRFELKPATLPLRAGQPIDFTFGISAVNGAPVPLGPVMGAYAHLVAFDSGRTGFAHLHPVQADPLAKPDPIRPAMSFKLTIPQAGRYVIWAQVSIGGRETFIPFWFVVS